MTRLFCLDNTLQPTIKDEKKDHHVDNLLKSTPISTDKIDQPLLIVLDEDDANEQSSLITPNINSKDDLSNTEEQKRNNSLTGISLSYE